MARTSSELGFEQPRPSRLVSPGPTPIPPEVVEALTRPLLHHRVPEFRAVLRNVRRDLQELARTQNPVLLLGCTGTAAMESAIVNLCSPSDPVLVVSAGYFGERWVTLAERYGCDVVALRYEWGAVPSPDDLERALRERPDIKAVFLVHSETSTGVVLDLQRFGAAAQSSGALLVVDAVSSLGAVLLETDAWGVDVLISSSHKALMTPPGIAIVFLSAAAREVAAASPLPRYYLDWHANLTPQSRDEPETWFSATVSLIVGLEAALSLIREEGFESRYQRHVQMGRQCRSAVKSIGLTLFSPDDDSSAVLTAVGMPDGVNSSEVVQAMHEQSRVTAADGEAILRGKIVRIGHLGYNSAEDVDLAVAALSSAVNAAPAVPKRGVA